MGPYCSGVWAPRHKKNTRFNPREILVALHGTRCQQVHYVMQCVCEIEGAASLSHEKAAPTDHSPTPLVAYSLGLYHGSAQVNTTILVIADRFSRGLRLVPLPALPSAFETAELLFTHVFRHCGIPEDIVRDHGPQVTSRVWSSFLKKL